MGTKVIAVLLSVLLATTTSGCWGRQEIDELSIVLGLGVDRAQTPGNIKLTLQIASATSPRGDSGGSQTPAPILAKTGIGKNIPDAIVRGFYQVSTHRTYFAHTLVAVLSKEAASEGIEQYIDFMLRHQEFRGHLIVLVSRGEAEQILRATPGHESVAAEALAALVRNQLRVGGARSSQLHELAEQMLDLTRAPTTAFVEVDPESAPPNPQGKEKGPQGLRVVGTAVFKRGKLIGELDQVQTRGLMWVLGEVKGGATVVPCEGDAPASILTETASSKVSGKMVSGRPQVKIEVNVAGALDNLACPTDPSKPEVLQKLNEQQAAVIEAEIENALDWAKQANADIFGFGEAVHRTYRGDWKAIEAKWDELFPQVEVNIEVKTTLKYVGLINQWRAQVGGTK